MISFLQEQTKQIFDHCKSDFDDISIIIPNKRAAVYIQKELSKLIHRPFFAPEILTINEWIDKNTEQRILNSTELLFILHKVHIEIEQDLAEKFEQFSQWGKVILSDFDEIDRYLIDPESIFKNLNEIKKIENWSFDSEELSDGQERFKNLWDKLITYYKQLNAKLDEQKLIYPGKAYSNFYNQIKSEKIVLKNHTYFLGFNAVSRSEQEIMNWFRKNKRGTIVFDIDQFYFENKNHEAGYFYNKICQAWGIPAKTSNNFNSIPKKIEIIETAQQTSQTKICGDLVKKLMNKGDNLNSTAIVLADESLLIPLTRSLPAEIESANITMGYPIKFSHLKGFIDLLFEFQFNFNKFKSDRLYYKPLLNLLQHPYLRILVNDNQKIADFQNDLALRNVIFIEQKEFIDNFKNLEKIRLIFTLWPDSTQDKLVLFDQMVDALQANFYEKSDKATDLELLHQFAKGVKKFKDIWIKYNTALTLKTFKNSFYQFWQAENLSFIGNPIDGLQIMGILETRTLDFDNLIILGMNEGSLPKSNIVNSMIPRDLRLFDKQLPTEEDRQAIFAHHFYRLIQRSSNVFMTYNSHSDGSVDGEQSRFITQLENELDISLGHELTRYTYSADDDNANTAATIYKSTPEIQSKLDRLFERGLSPSALNKFVSCPLDFYYRYVIGLKEEGEIEENIESSTFGTKIHDVLEGIIRDNFFINDTGSALTVTALKAEKKKVSTRLTDAYLNGENGRNFTKSDLKFGQNKLSFEVSERLIQAFLDQQIKEVTDNTDAIVPVGLELDEEFYANLEFEVKGVKKPLKISGTADRIDKKGDLYRIIDYKSGTCNETKVKIPSHGKKAEEIMPDFIRNDKKGYGRQLLMYGLMFQQSFPSKSKFSAGIISMVNITDWLQNVKKDKDETHLDLELLSDFKIELQELIAEMYEDGFEFMHNPDSKYCEHCGK